MQATHRQPDTDNIRLVLRSLVGSRMWGIHREDSDYDYREVVVLPLSRALSPWGTKGIKLNSGDRDDSVRYDVRDLLRLVTKGNPTLMEVVFSPHQEVLDPFWHEIDFSRLLDSTNIVNAHSGLTTSQWKRAEKEIDRGDYTRAGKSLSVALLSLRMGCQLRTTKTVTFEMTDEEREFHVKLRNGEWTDRADGLDIVLDRIERVRRQLRWIDDSIPPFHADPSYAELVSYHLHMGHLDPYVPQHEEYVDKAANAMYKFLMTEKEEARV